VKLSLFYRPYNITIINTYLVPTIFGTVGNPSDSLASCTNLATGQADMIIPVMTTVNISVGTPRNCFQLHGRRL